MVIFAHNDNKLIEMIRGKRGCKTATNGLKVASRCALFGLVLNIFESVAIILKSNISHNIPAVYCDLKFQTFWHIGYGFLSEQFAVAEWKVLYSPPESHHSTFTLVAYLPGPWRSVSLTPSVYSLFQSLSLYCISLLAKMLLGTFCFLPTKFSLACLQNSDDFGVSLPGKEMEFTGSLNLKI